jgi:hypothetical protein
MQSAFHADRSSPPYFEKDCSNEAVNSLTSEDANSRLPLGTSVLAETRQCPIRSYDPKGKVVEGMDWHLNRTAHVHFIMIAPSLAPAVAKIFIPSCRYPAEDAVLASSQKLSLSSRSLTQRKR